jgi:hypothetical protein
VAALSDSDGTWGPNWFFGANTRFNAPNVNVNSIPNVNTNTFAPPNTAEPNLNGNTTVDTASLAAFGSWVSNDLPGPLQDLKPKLEAVQVEPGSFYWADYIRSYVNGTGPTSGLKNQFVTVIEDLLGGLAGIGSGVQELVKKYGTTEDLNSATAANLENDMANSFGNASSSFGHLGSDGQGGGGSSNGSG